MSEEHIIDPLVWFSDRELKYSPRHFVPAKSQLTMQSKSWIINRLKGRYALVVDESALSDDILGVAVIPTFEDPQEAILYELTWSS